MKRSRTGRRPGSPDTREAILAAARGLFADRGFDSTTVRAIAAEASVDPALVHHYFGTKEQLFHATVEVPIDPQSLVASVVSGGPNEIGVRLVRTFITTWDSPAGAAGAALLRSAMSSDWGARLMREFLATQILRRVTAELELEPAEAALRAGLAASQMTGLALTRYILKLEPIASAPPEQLVALLSPTIQHYLTGPLPSLPSP